MKKKQPKQLMLPGSKQPRQSGAGGFVEFMRVSSEESGLLAPSQAALVLEITPTRVLQLLEDGQLKRWDFFGRPYVSARQIDERRRRDVKAGRPPRNLAARMMLQGKVLATSNPAQIAAILVE